MPNNLSLGRLGERIAVDYLSREGYQIIETNFHKRWGEIDIVAQDKDTLVFVEVKTRMEGDRITPEESMTGRKINSIKRSGQYYKLKHPELPENLRIDFLGIVLNEKFKPVRINLVKNIFF